MYYRKELDGIRAVAVLSVVFYHAGLPFLSGGYIGVDIFFVLSGYLITSIIYKQINANCFSFSDFYWRRFRRILPALFFMMAVVAVVGAKVFDPVMFKNFGTSIWTTALFSSNIYFWSEAGYFQKAAELKPLLHTWSLGVEEQYYIFFPFLMIFINKWFPKSFVQILAIVGISSLLLSAVAVYYKPIASFYLLPTRLWELLIGSLIAVSTLSNLKNRITINCISWAGFVLLLFPIFFYSKETLFPGLTALVPCLGTGLIIWSLNNNHNTVLKRMLGFAPVAFVGRVSYSFYLWHWPALIISQYYALTKLTVADKMIVLGAAFVISCFSYYIIEKPFRENFSIFPKNRMLKISVISILVFSVYGLFIVKLDGLPQRFDMKLDNIIQAQEDKSFFNSSSCNNFTLENREREFCRMGTKNPKEKVDFLLWGDSHAGAIAPVFDAVARNLGLNGKLAVWSGCPPLLGVQRQTTVQNFNCLTDRRLVRDYILKEKSLKTVFLIARWGFYVENSVYGDETVGKVLAVQYNHKDVTQHDLMIAEALDETVSWLISLGKKVVLIMPVPEVGFDVPTTLAKHVIRGDNSEIRPTLIDYQNRQNKFLKLGLTISKKHNIDLIYPHEILCGPKYCEIIKDGYPNYFDDDHLSIHGAMQLKYIVKESLEKNFDSTTKARINEVRNQVSHGHWDQKQSAIQ